MDQLLELFSFLVICRFLFLQYIFLLPEFGFEGCLHMFLHSVLGLLFLFLFNENF
jgi:hypothetical protein